MKDLLAKLEAATEAEQKKLILEALQFAYDQGWINLVITGKAARWVRHGAYLSAAMVLVPMKIASWKLMFNGKTHSHQCSARLWIPNILHEGHGATPALAVTIAAMKAHDTQRNEP